MSTINEMTNALEELTDIRDFREIKKTLMNFPKEQNEYEEYDYELLAFSFVEDQEDDYGKGSYYGPESGFHTENGYQRSPNIDRIDENVINYWKNRAEETDNYLLKARYSDLVWEFSKVLKLKGSSNLQYVLMAINSYIEIIENRLFNTEMSLIKVSKRAFSLAQTINDLNEIQKTKGAMIKFEQGIESDSLPGLWGFSYDCLIGNRKVNLDKDEESIIITMLEERLDRLFLSNEDESNSIEHGAVRLAEYYSKKKQFSAIQDLLKKIEQLYETYETVENIHRTEYNFQRLYQLYKEHNMNEDASRVLARISRLGKQISDSLIYHEFSTEIKREELESLFEVLLKGDLEQDIFRVCLYFTPIKEETQKQVLELDSRYPLANFFSKSILSENGRMIATIGSVEDDLEGNILKQTADNLQISMQFLDLVINELTKRHDLSSERTFELLKLSPAFAEDKFEFIKQGINLFYTENYVASMHILIPQIEDSLRNIIRICEGNTIKPNQKGGFDAILLSDILKSKILEDVFNDDIILYFKVVLNDGRGLNLRNNLAHGLAGINTFNRGIANLVLHLLLIISLFREEL